MNRFEQFTDYELYVIEDALLSVFIDDTTALRAEIEEELKSRKERNGKA